MTATKQGLTAENLVALHDEAKILPVLLAGTLDAKIAECKALIAELKQRQGVVATLDEAAKIKANAEANAAICESQITASREAFKHDVNVVNAALEADGAKLRTQTHAFASERAAFEAAHATRSMALQKKETDLNQLEQELNRRQSDLTALREQLANDQGAFNRKLDALRA